MRLQITDYSQQADLADAIRRYHVLLQMSFDTTSMYKIFETPHSQISRFGSLPVPPPQQMARADTAVLEMPCPQCKNHIKIQANLDKAKPLQDGCLPFPLDNKVKCPKCGTEIDVLNMRRQLEAQTKKRIV